MARYLAISVQRAPVALFLIYRYATHALIIISVHFSQKLTAEEHVGVFVNSTFTILISAIFRCLILHEDLMALVNELLFALDVLEHVLALRHAHIVWKHFRVVLVELEHAWQPILRLFERVEALEILREVVKDQILFEYRNYMSLFVVHNIG